MRYIYISWCITIPPWLGLGHFQIDGVQLPSRRRGLLNPKAPALAGRASSLVSHVDRYGSLRIVIWASGGWEIPTSTCVNHILRLLRVGKSSLPHMTHKGFAECEQFLFEVLESKKRKKQERIPKAFWFIHTRLYLYPCILISIDVKLKSFRECRPASCLKQILLCTSACREPNCACA